MWTVVTTPAENRATCLLPASPVSHPDHAPARQSRLAFVLLLCLWLALPSAAHANPTVPAGSSATFAKSGTSAPGVMPWDIVLAGSAVASASSPNGWSVSYNSSTQQFTVGAPTSATITAG